MSMLARKSRLHRLPKIGDTVSVQLRKSSPSYPNGTVGKVIEILDACCGPLLAVQFPSYPGVTVDLPWKRVRKAE
jgi:hypothetical protein